MNRPTLRQLSFLVALADERHFARAAQRCNVTQSTLSAGIRELEANLGVPLAERTKRTVRMTATGLEIAGRARILLNDADELVRMAARSREPLSGELKLGVIPTVGPFILPRMMSAVRDRYPGLRLYLREQPTDLLLEALAAGELDAALMAFPFQTDGVDREILFEDGYRLACPADHPLARRRKLGRKDIEDLRLMLLQREHCLHRHALSAFAGVDLQQDVRFEATSLATLVAMVAEGLGVTLLPELAIDAGLADAYDIALVPVSDICPREIGLAWRRSSGREEEFRLLGRLILSASRSNEVKGGMA
jgi:LysR family hydrogen peroxide-inducible transcriptional activator